MATVGGIREVEGIANSAETEQLARFAVDEHNKKEVFSKFLSFSLLAWFHFFLENSNFIIIFFSISVV